MNPASSPILVIDSGLGGLTVVRALRTVLPDEPILYFGDTARLPYGTKSPAAVNTFIRQIITYLLPHDPKHIVLACNTATALTLPAIRSDFPELSISGVIDPGAKAAVAAAGSKQCPVIGVIATEATIRSRAYDRAILRRRHHARLLRQPASLLVPIIEEGRGDDDPLVELALRQYLNPMLKLGMDVLVLGCTHYPLLRGCIQRVTGDGMPVIDSAEQCAEDIARRLGRGSGPQAPDRPEGDRTAPAAAGGGGATAAADEAGQAEAALAGAVAEGMLTCLVTDDPARFARLARRFLGVKIDPPTPVALEELYAAGAEGAGGEALPAHLRRAV